ncbi:MAG: hypothetical protein ACR2HJ_05285 [Fimbriimonadales bacterium]
MAIQPTLVDGGAAASLKGRLLLGADLGKIPLLLLGAGVSHGTVPLFREIGTWFLEYFSGKPEFPDDLIALSKSIAGAGTRRRDAAEFFVRMQAGTEASITDAWEAFSNAFVLGQMKIGSVQYKGIYHASPTAAHREIAKMLFSRSALAVSLNFDGLTHQALLKKGSAVSLHSHEELIQYFCSTSGDLLPAVIKIRGDVFFLKCINPSCPLSASPIPVERAKEFTTEDALSCPLCKSKTRLDISFPGDRVKEDLARPLLTAIAELYHSRISAIILVGISGRWDEYLLRFIFDLAIDEGIPVVDCKPPDETSELIDGFRQAHYREIPSFNGNNVAEAEGPAYYRIEEAADTFCTQLGGWME